MRLFELTQGVAPLLPGQWRYNHLAEKRSDVRHANEAILNDDIQPGRQLVFRPCWDSPGRIRIAGSLPQGLSKTHITVSEERTPAAVAGDITRRLLPDYLAEWKDTETRRRERESEMELYRHQVDLLRRFVPEFHQLYNRTLSGADEFHFQDGSVQLYSNYKASLQLSLPFEDLVRVLMALYSHAP
jgi:hypothetical protein